MYKIEYVDKNTVYILIDEKDYEKIYKNKTTYTIEIIGIYGKKRIKNKLYKNRFLIISFFMGILILYILSNVIFKIEIIHNDQKIRQIIYKELSSYGIKNYKFKKTYKEIQKIKEKIINDYKDDIEWLEIEEYGTKYVVRVEERILTKEKEQDNPRNIISKKDAIITNIDCIKGEIVKNINSYVKKGDVIISGEIKLYDEVKKIVAATGTVYGEVWYKQTIEYPYKYYEEKQTGRRKKVLSLHLSKKTIDLFNFKKYKNKIVEEKKLLQNNIFPIYLSIDTQKEIEIINKNFSKEEIEKEAIKVARKKIEDKLSKEEEIINIKIINKEEKQNSIILELFVTVKENITDYKDIQIEQ